MLVFCVLIIVSVLMCVSQFTLCQKLGRPNFLEEIFGLTHLLRFLVAEQNFLRTLFDKRQQEVFDACSDTSLVLVRSECWTTN
jgi:hypothetical protein